MKKFLTVVMMSVSLCGFASDKKPSAIKAESKNKAPQETVKASPPCATTQEEIMKQIEEKKKAQANSADTKTAGLQGLGAATTGCKVK